MIKPYFRVPGNRKRLWKVKQEIFGFSIQIHFCGESWRAAHSWEQTIFGYCMSMTTQKIL